MADSLRIIIFIILVFSHGPLISQPLLNTPTFKKLSTEQGLPQDTVLSVLIDQYGFLWLGTENGISRYDGYRVQTISGKNNELSDVSVNYIFEGSNGTIYFSVETVGLYALSRETGEINLLINRSYIDYHEFYQAVIAIIELSEHELIIAFEEEIFLFDTATTSPQLLYTLPEYLIKQENIIRDIALFDDVLFVGTSGELLAFNIHDPRAKTIDYLQEEMANDDKLNSKKLYSPDNMNLWVGTVEGLYALNLANVIGFIMDENPLPVSEVLMPELNIWDIEYGAGDFAYLATDQGLYAYYVKEKRAQHIFKPMDSRYYIADNDLTSINIDQDQNLWLGTKFDGALYWSPMSVSFKNVYQQSQQTGKLSNNTVWSFYQENEDFLWVGTNNGLNRFDLRSGELQSYLVNSDLKQTFSNATIDQILKFDDERLLLLTPEGFRLFNHQTLASDNLIFNQNTDEAMELIPWGAQVDNNGNIYFATDTGWFKYNALTASLDNIEALNSQVDAWHSYGFLRAREDEPNKMLVSMPNALWEYDTATEQVRLLHQASVRKVKTEIFPESYVEDDNILWINYTGLGLFGVDKTSGKELYFLDKSSGLNVTTTYGLEQSDLGNIWLSSHSGLLMFHPDRLNVKRFSQAEGLLTNEYNAFASLKLLDGRMAYGSVKGFTIFNPDDLASKQVAEPTVNISGIAKNGDASKLHLSPKLTKIDTLEYDDSALTLEYSTLRFAELKTTKYRVELQGKTNIVYPESKDSSITIPKLSPGEYQLKLSAIDTSNETYGPSKLINITVSYPIWGHPVAYLLYVVLTLCALTLWIRKRNLRLLEIGRAHALTSATKNKLSLALAATNSGTWEWDASTDMFLSDSYEKLGYSEQMRPNSLAKHLNLVHPQDRKKVEQHWNDLTQGKQQNLDVTYRIRALDQTWQWYRDTGSAVTDEHQHSKIIGTSSNITEKRAHQEKAKIFGEAFKQTNDWVLIFDNDYHLVSANPAFMRAYEISDESHLSDSFCQLLADPDMQLSMIHRRLKYLHSGDRFKDEYEVMLPNATKHHVLANMAIIDDHIEAGTSDYYLVIISDISEQKQAQDDLRRLANYDSLTNLPNRVLLVDRINHALDTASRKEHIVGLFFLDLDRFKQVNDSLGHNIGDELLERIAERLTNVCRQNDTVARLGGDEFVIMIEDVVSPDSLSVFAQKVINTIEAPIILNNQNINVSTSLGIAMYPSDADCTSELMKNADLAMYSAKEKGKGQFQFFTKDLNERAYKRLYLENKLKLAYRDDHLENYYQPIINVEQNEVVGFELLLRWPDGDVFIPPDVFIPIAEEIGMIDDITTQAIVRAVPLLNEWKALGFKGYLSINLSARQFERKASIQHLISIAKQYEISPEHIRFEITESALMESYDKAQLLMKQLCEAGFKISLDDFGTGYSSLQYLKTFPIQGIKIDRSFVADIGVDNNDEAIILAILKIAESLGLGCIAEGIETKEQLDFLYERGCKYQQGYYFSKPVPKAKTIDLLNAKQFREFNTKPV